MNPLITAILSLGIFLFILPIIRNAGAETFLNLDALLIIGSGTLIGLLIGFPVQRIKMAFRHVKESFGDHGDRNRLLKEILLMAGIYKRGQIRELERRQGEIKDDFFRMGIHLLINQHPVEEIKNILEREMSLRIVSHNLSQNILKTMARLTPALGLAGTIISLIKMFDHFQSLETLTPMMAVALMSTFYGVIIANLIMLPLASKLKEKATLSESLMAMTIEGLVAISAQEHPLKIEEKLAGVSRVKEAPTGSPEGHMAWGEVKIGL
jgi:chemotaxis protein MotA